MLIDTQNFLLGDAQKTVHVKFHKVDIVNICQQYVKESVSSISRLSIIQNNISF